MRNTRKFPLLAASTVAAALLAIPTTAWADSSGCSGNACIQVTGVAGGDVTVTGSVAGTRIQGTITITAPGGFSSTSNDQIWNPSDPGVTPPDTYEYGFTGAWTGTYCVQVYDDNNNANGGQACENVHG